jgi:DNA repair exonuclease SbcCD ATPase subunit
MHIARLTLVNFMRFRGAQVLALEPKAYAILAQWQGNADRSNWSGKSSLVEAVVFALFGEHRFRTEDAWITRGEAQGGVKLEFADGTVIERRRARGKRTELFFVDASGTSALQEEAQTCIELCLGIDREELRNTSYFEQKKLAAFVTARPEARMATVSAWFDLEKLREATTVVQRRLKEHRDVSASFARERQRRLDEAAAAVAASGSDSDLEHVRTTLAAAYARLEGMQKAAEIRAARAGDARSVAQYQALVVHGRDLRSKVDGFSPPELGGLDEAILLGQDTLSVVRAKISEAKKCTVGQWDGACPLVGVACPAQATVRSADQADRLSVLRFEEAGLLAGVGEQRTKATAWRAAVVEHEYNQKRLAELREAAVKARAEAELAAERLKVESPPDDPAEHRLLTDQIQQMHAAIARADESRKRHALVIGEGEAKEDPQIPLLAAASAILVGTERAVAEGSLSAIEAGANSMLAECGIELSVGMSWTREGKDLAKTCVQCGAAFPSSAKIRECVCGAPRGQNVMRRLDVELSDSSGAAEDLVGAAIQLTASNWLREKRESSFSVALIDEPFGACDKANRKAFAVNLSKILKTSFEQSFVISHSPDTVEMFPGKILVTAHADYSTAAVV